MPACDIERAHRANLAILIIEYPARIVDLAVALQRNVARNKAGGPEPEDFVRRRHARFARLDAEGPRFQAVDTTEPLENSM